MKSIVTLRRCVQEWLANHELDGDTAFCTRGEWTAQDAAFLAHSELILVFEGELYRVASG